MIFDIGLYDFTSIFAIWLAEGSTHLELGLYGVLYCLFYGHIKMHVLNNHNCEKYVLL